MYYRSHSPFSDLRGRSNFSRGLDLGITPRIQRVINSRRPHNDSWTNYYDLVTPRYTSYTIKKPQRTDYTDFLGPALQSRTLLKPNYVPRSRLERESVVSPLVRERKLIKFREITNDILTGVRRKISWDLPEEIDSPLINEMKKNEAADNISERIKSRENSLSRRGSPTVMSRRSSDQSIDRMSRLRLKSPRNSTELNLERNDLQSIHIPRKKSLGSSRRIKKHKPSIESIDEKILNSSAIIKDKMVRNRPHEETSFAQTVESTQSADLPIRRRRRPEITCDNEGQPPDITNHMHRKSVKYKITDSPNQCVSEQLATKKPSEMPLKSDINEAKNSRTKEVPKKYDKQNEEKHPSDVLTKTSFKSKNEEKKFNSDSNTIHNKLCKSEKSSEKNELLNIINKDTETVPNSYIKNSTVLNIDRKRTDKTAGNNLDSKGNDLDNTSAEKIKSSINKPLEKLNSDVIVNKDLNCNDNAMISIPNRVNQENTKIKNVADLKDTSVKHNVSNEIREDIKILESKQPVSKSDSANKNVSSENESNNISQNSKCNLPSANWASKTGFTASDVLDKPKVADSNKQSVECNKKPKTTHFSNDQKQKTNNDALKNKKSDDIVIKNKLPEVKCNSNFEKQSSNEKITPKSKEFSPKAMNKTNLDQSSTENNIKSLRHESNPALLKMKIKNNENTSEIKSSNLNDIRNSSLFTPTDVKSQDILKQKKNISLSQDVKIMSKDQDEIVVICKLPQPKSKSNEIISSIQSEVNAKATALESSVGAINTQQPIIPGKTIQPIDKPDNVETHIKLKEPDLGLEVNVSHTVVLKSKFQNAKTVQAEKNMNHLKAIPDLIQSTIKISSDNNHKDKIKKNKDSNNNKLSVDINSNEIVRKIMPSEQLKSNDEIPAKNSYEIPDPLPYNNNLISQKKEQNEIILNKEIQTLSTKSKSNSLNSDAKVNNFKCSKLETKCSDLKSNYLKPLVPISDSNLSKSETKVTKNKNLSSEKTETNDRDLEANEPKVLELKIDKLVPSKSTVKDKTLECSKPIIKNGDLVTSTLKTVKPMIKSNDSDSNQSKTVESKTSELKFGKLKSMLPKVSDVETSESKTMKTVGDLESSKLISTESKHSSNSKPKSRDPEPNNLKAIESKLSDSEISKSKPLGPKASYVKSEKLETVEIKTAGIESSKPKALGDSDSRKLKTVESINELEFSNSKIIDSKTSDMKFNKLKAVVPKFSNVEAIKSKTVDTASDIESSKSKTVDAASNIESSKSKTVDTARDIESSKSKTVDTASNIKSSKLKTGDTANNIESSKSKTVDTARDIESSKSKTMDATSNIKSKTVDTASNIKSKTVDTASDIDSSKSKTMDTARDIKSSKLKTVNTASNIESSKSKTVDTARDIDSSKSKTIGPKVDDLEWCKFETIDPKTSDLESNKSKTLDPKNCDLESKKSEIKNSSLESGKLKTLDTKVCCLELRKLNPKESLELSKPNISSVKSEKPDTTEIKSVGLESRAEGSVPLKIAEKGNENKEVLNSSDKPKLKLDKRSVCRSKTSENINSTFESKTSEIEEKTARKRYRKSSTVPNVETSEKIVSKLVPLEKRWKDNSDCSKCDLKTYKDADNNSQLSEPVGLSEEKQVSVQNRNCNSNENKTGEHKLSFKTKTSEVILKHLPEKILKVVSDVKDKFCNEVLKKEETVKLEHKVTDTDTLKTSNKTANKTGLQEKPKDTTDLKNTKKTEKSAKIVDVKSPVHKRKKDLPPMSPRPTRYGLVIGHPVNLYSSSSDSESWDSSSSVSSLYDSPYEDNEKSSLRGFSNGVEKRERLSSTVSNSTIVTNFSTLSLDESPPKTPKKLNFRKYTIDDFLFLKLLGTGSFGKVLLAELKDHDMFFAVKCLRKDTVLEDDDVESAMIERRVLALGTQHPYLCKLYCTFQTDSYLFFVMEYLNGGDLMFHIQNGQFEESRAMFYGAEIVSALKFLHKRGIVYRDIKLDNILFDKTGHVHLVDFGMCKSEMLDPYAKTSTFCGTPDYIPPEIILGQRYNQSVDWWSFGVLLFEMILGRSPFVGTDEDELFWSICNEEPSYPHFISKQAKDILQKLLTKSVSDRLGMPSSPYGEIKEHPFFISIDWNKLEKKEVPPPFKPTVISASDTRNFDRSFTMNSPSLSPVDSAILQSMDQEQFLGFSYTNPNIVG
ncbi:uncharacterized protein [Parasteatoda tepidariorum]|uniref:uncharacterized protein isoform X1 n=1 Tax=Parasteatoda tepidariorum TaxID=114398 RepID=UPI001C726703|nr:putative leucine-rich repeat-containing protein DDB_G0290503 isoform X1 [Parasteatoda tepidariorum]